MTTWKKFLSVAAVAAVVGLALAWGVYGDASLGKEVSVMHFLQYLLSQPLRENKHRIAERIKSKFFTNREFINFLQVSF